jgi:hypothetical protein
MDLNMKCRPCRKTKLVYEIQALLLGYLIKLSLYVCVCVSRKYVISLTHTSILFIYDALSLLVPKPRPLNGAYWIIDKMT